MIAWSCFLVAASRSAQMPWSLITTLPAVSLSTLQLVEEVARSCTGMQIK